AEAYAAASTPVVRTCGHSGSQRTALYARCRRQVARRGLWPGWHQQQLHRRRRRQGEPAADRRGDGARSHQSATGFDDPRAAQAGLRALAARHGGDRDLSTVLYSWQSDHTGTVPYVVNLTAENAGRGQQVRTVPLDYPVRPGDTIVVKERWFLEI